MKSAKIIFSLAFVALIFALTFMFLFLFAPEYVPTQQNEVVQNEENVQESETEKTTEDVEAELQALAQTEIKRFKDEYGLDISMESMMKELKIRLEYEETYGKSYDLEEIFIVEVPEDDTVGDESDDEYEEVIQKIQKYIELYGVDETRYASMTAYEELDALEVEYGPLPEGAIENEDSEDVEEQNGGENQEATSNVSIEIVGDGETDSSEVTEETENTEEAENTEETEDTESTDAEQEETTDQEE